jgi:hypothetical protein
MRCCFSRLSIVVARDGEEGKSKIASENLAEILVFASFPLFQEECNPRLLLWFARETVLWFVVCSRSNAVN